MTLPELIEVLKAAAEGKPIEARAKGSEQWSEVTLVGVGGLAARLAVGDILRVKPEPRAPRDFWANRYKNCWGPMHESADEASVYSDFEVIERIHVREVLE